MMTGIIIDIIFFLIILIFCVVGYFKGFLRTVLSLLGFAGALIIAYFTRDFFGNLFNSWFGWGDGISNFVLGQVEGLSPSFVTDSKTTVEGLLQVIESSDANLVYKALLGQVIGRADFSSGAITVGQAVAGVVTGIIMSILAMVIIFLIIRIIVWIVDRILRRIPRDSIVGEVNKWLGFILGIARGIVTVGCLLALIYILCLAPVVSDAVSPYIEQTTVTKWAYDLIGQIILSL